MSVRNEISLINWQPIVPDKEVYLYKVIPIKHLLSWIASNSMRFDQIAKWDDVYELFLFKQKYIHNGQPVGFDAHCKAIFGQSWSVARDSDALWRIYSPDHLSVRIKTTYSKLKNSLEQSNGFQQALRIYLGYVKYYNKKAIENIIKTEYVPHLFDEKTIVDSLFVKRDSFSFEKEMRIILWKGTIKEESGKNIPCHIPDYVSLNIAPIDLIQEVAFDYRLDDHLYNSLKSVLQIALPFVRIQKSTLGTIDSKTYTI